MVEECMQLVLPSWFKQRQGKAEPAGPDTYRLTAPQLAESYISIRRGANGLWYGALRMTADGPDVAVTEPVCATPAEAWEAAFELHRTHLVV
jgi:hypothetical protein